MIYLSEFQFKYFNLNLFFVISLIIFLFSCDSQNIIKEKKEKFLIIVPEEKWGLKGPISNESKTGVQSDGNFVFKVFVYPPEDTINLLDDSSLKDYERSSYGRNYQLAMDTCVSIDQVEAFLRINGFYNHSFRENLYWMCKLSSASIIENKNYYGDIESYSVKAKNKTIPEEYYRLDERGTDIFTNRMENDHSLVIFPKTQYIVDLFADDSLTYLSISIVLYSPSKNYNPDIAYDKIRFEHQEWGRTSIFIDPQNVKFKLKKGYSIGLEINVNTFLDIENKKYGNYDFNYNPPFFPFDLKIIEK